MARSRRRALLVDDSDSIRAVLRSMLEQDLVDVVEARDGAEGLEKLQSEPSIGLVFLDVNMPGVGGLEMLRLIRADPAFVDLPVVVLTGSAPSVVSAAKELGAVGWLQKPVRVDAIIKVAQKFLPA
jgi:two-component system chemotaxis response regulator CheY